METYRVAVISDTHGLLRPEVLEVLGTCEAVLHGGDMDDPETLERLRQAGPVYAVRGNGDGDWARDLPRELEVELFGFRFYMVHNKKHLPGKLPPGVDVVIWGHSHRQEERRSPEGVWYLNPGSCGPRRFRLSATMMVLTLDPKERRVEVEKISLVSQKPVAAPAGTPTGQDLYEAVGVIVKEIPARRDVADIAARHRLDEKFVERVCRIYLTHPGVDMDGIMNRLL